MQIQGKLYTECKYRKLNVAYLNVQSKQNGKYTLKLDMIIYKKIKEYSLRTGAQISSAAH